MSKHIIDKSHPNGDEGRMKAYTKLDKAKSGKPGKQTEKLRRAPRNEDDAERMERFLKADRKSE